MKNGHARRELLSGAFTRNGRRSQTRLTAGRDAEHAQAGAGAMHLIVYGAPRASSLKTAEKSVVLFRVLTKHRAVIPVEKDHGEPFVCLVEGRDVRRGYVGAKNQRMNAVYRAEVFQRRVMVRDDWNTLRRAALDRGYYRERLSFLAPDQWMNAECQSSDENKKGGAERESEPLDSWRQAT